MIRVALVDDQELIRGGLAMVVEAAEGMTVVAEAGDGEEALAVLSRVPADVVLMDVRMPRLDGIAATAALTARAPTPRVIVLTTFDLDEYAYAALRAGAAGFLLKDATAVDVVAAVRAVHAGDAVIAPPTTRRMIDTLMRAEERTPDAAGAAALRSLTAREREVLHAIADGLSNAEIGQFLHLSAGTVKTHIGHLLAKLGLRDRVQLVIFAYDQGLTRPGDRRTQG